MYHIYKKQRFILSELEGNNYWFFRLILVSALRFLLLLRFLVQIYSWRLECRLERSLAILFHTRATSALYNICRTISLNLFSDLHSRIISLVLVISVCVSVIFQALSRLFLARLLR